MSKRYKTLVRAIARKVLLFILMAMLTGTAASAQVDKKDAVRRGRESYYSLKKLGLVGFRATIRPDWDLMLKDKATDSDGLRRLQALHFSVLFGREGDVVINRSSDFAPPNQKTADGFKQIFDGIEKAMKGFFQTWNLFMFDNPLPEVDDAYELTNIGEQLLLSYKEPNDTVSTTLAKDYSISEIKASSATFNATINPRFRKMERGYVLVGYRATYVPITGPGKTEGRVDIQYTNVKGLELPSKLIIDGSQDGEIVHMELTLGDYEVETSTAK